MALEIERRFLVRSDAWRSSAGSAQPLRQGYLAASADGVTVRMRLRGSDQAWLTLKAAADAVGLVRHEFEYPIPVADAEALWDCLLYTSPSPRDGLLSRMPSSA